MLLPAFIWLVTHQAINDPCHLSCPSCSSSVPIHLSLSSAPHALPGHTNLAPLAFKFIDPIIACCDLERSVHLRNCLPMIHPADSFLLALPACLHFVCSMCHLATTLQTVNPPDSVVSVFDMKTSFLNYSPVVDTPS